MKDTMKNIFANVANATGKTGIRKGVKCRQMLDVCGVYYVPLSAPLVQVLAHSSGMPRYVTFPYTVPAGGLRIEVCDGAFGSSFYTLPEGSVILKHVRGNPHVTGTLYVQA